MVRVKGMLQRCWQEKNHLFFFKSVHSTDAEPRRSVAKPRDLLVPTRKEMTATWPS